MAVLPRVYWCRGSPAESGAGRSGAEGARAPATREDGDRRSGASLRHVPPTRTSRNRCRCVSSPTWQLLLPHLATLPGTALAAPPARRAVAPSRPETLACASSSSSNVTSVISLLPPLPGHGRKPFLWLLSTRLHLASSSRCRRGASRVSRGGPGGQGPDRFPLTLEAWEPACCHTAAVWKVPVDLRGPRKRVVRRVRTVHRHRQKAVASARPPRLLPTWTSCPALSLREAGGPLAGAPLEPPGGCGEHGPSPTPGRRASVPAPFPRRGAVSTPRDQLFS